MDSDELGQLYKETILEHQKEPRNFGELKNADASEEGYNPLCGDRVIVDVKRDKDGKALCDIRFRGEGCSICMASASIMTEEVEGEPIPKVCSKIEEFRNLMQGKVDPDDVEGDVQALAGVRRFPVRIKCALLPWTTLKATLEKPK